MRIYGINRICPGKRHAWYDTDIGLIRKPIMNLDEIKEIPLVKRGILLTKDIPVDKKISLWNKIIDWIKKWLHLNKKS